MSHGEREMCLHERESGGDRDEENMEDREEEMGMCICMLLAYP